MLYSNSCNISRNSFHSHFCLPRTNKIVNINRRNKKSWGIWSYNTLLGISIFENVFLSKLSRNLTTDHGDDSAASPNLNIDNSKVDQSSVDTTNYRDTTQNNDITEQITDDSTDSIAVSSKHNEIESIFDSDSNQTVHDNYITSSDMEVIKLYTQRSEVMDEAKSLFDKFTRIEAVDIIPNEELVHLKSKTNAKNLYESSKSHVGIKWEVWKKLYSNFINIHLTFLNILKPLGDSYLENLSNVIRGKSELRTSPFYALEKALGNVSSKIIYGTSLGAHELISFYESLYSSVSIKYSYSSDASGSTTFDLNLSNGKSPDNFTYKFDLQYFEPNELMKDFSLKEKNSMYYKDSCGRILKTLFNIESPIPGSGIESPNSIQVSQSNRESRSGFITTQNNSKVTFSDGFMISGITNGEDFSFRINDKSIVEMIVSLMHVKNMELTNEQIKHLCGYIMTVLNRYVLQQMYMIDGVKIVNLTWSIKITKNEGYIDQNQLDKFYHKCVNEGKIMPITLLHYKFLSSKYFDIDMDIKWLEYIFWTAIAAPNINQNLTDFLPEIDFDSKNSFQLYCINRNLLSSKGYMSQIASIESQLNIEAVITFDEFLRELMVVGILRNEVPEYLPFITRSKWHGTSSSSVRIDVPRWHPISKLMLSDVTFNLYDYVNSITMRSKKINFPRFIRTQTRLTEDITNTFDFVLPDNEGDEL